MRARTVSFLLIVGVAALAVATLATAPVAAQDADEPGLPGSGTADDPYEISDAEELQAMERDLDAHYVLVADVDASETREWNEGRGFDPVGSPEEPFTGTLDGNEHAITDLAIDRSEPASIGLFGALGSDARVERLALEDVSLDSDLDKFYPAGGGIAGHSAGEIHQVAVTGETGTVGPSGGLVGVNNGTIEESYGRLSFGVDGTSGAVAGANNGEIRRAYAVAPVYDCGYPDCDYLGVAVGTDDGVTRNVYEHGYETETTFRHEGLDREAATGTDAIESMEDLQFGDTWRATAGFPVLAWQYDGPDLPGVGLADQPFRVATVEDLDEVRRNRTAHYVLVEDVDASGTASWQASDGSAGFEPIGTSERPFAGAFDGQGHGISGLTVDRPGATHVGLFGVVDDGVVSNVSLREAEVTGDAAVGALVGTNRGTVRESSADGTVTGSRIVGGLVGRNGGSVARSYSAASVTGTERTGGLLGSNDAGNVAEAYAAGAVDGDRAASTGGLVGEEIGGDVEAGYWDVQATGQDDSATGTGLTTAELTGDAPRSTTDLTFAEPPTYEQPWVATERYPLLAHENVDPVGLSGAGTAADPYRIEDATDLSSIRADLDAHYLLVDDVDASETTEWNQGAGFEPIGAGVAVADLYGVEVQSRTFDGALAGDGHAIHGLAVDRPRAVGVGLFGSVGTEGRVTDLELRDVNVTGESAVGAVAGASEGTVEDVTVDGRVEARLDGDEGGEFAGAVAGVSSGTVAAAESSATVLGRAEVGGVVGRNEGRVVSVRTDGAVRGDSATGGVVGANDYDGEVAAATANATVTSREQSGSGLGGVVGDNRGSVVEAVARGRVDSDGGSFVGGLVGRNTGEIRAAHAHTAVSGDRDVGGLIGYQHTDSRLQELYATGAVAGEDAASTGGLIGDGGTGVVLTVEAVYWDVAATGQNRSAAGTALTTDELTGEGAAERLDGFDFGTTWTATDAYPALSRLNDSDLHSGDENETGHDCVSIDGQSACDTDGDGHYRDVTGDGSVGQTDVVEFFRVQHRDAWKQPSMFDFSGNGEVGHGDVVALFEDVATR